MTGVQQEQEPSREKADLRGHGLRTLRSATCATHDLQNVCPQSRDTGSTLNSRQIEHVKRCASNATVFTGRVTVAGVDAPSAPAVLETADASVRVPLGVPSLLSAATGDSSRGTDQPMLTIFLLHERRSADNDQRNRYCGWEPTFMLCDRADLK